MTESDIIDSGIPVARLSNVRRHSFGCVEVEWAEGDRAGKIEIVDLRPAIYAYKVYRPLRSDPLLFGTVHLVEGGHAIGWNGKTSLDMSAELVQSLATETITPEQFAAFLERNQLTQQAAAIMLGRSRRQVINYLKEGPIPRVVALACIGYESLMRRSQSETPSVRPISIRDNNNASNRFQRV